MTTGYVTTEYGMWSQTAQTLMLIVLPIGAMAGSTAGGVKILRVMAVSSFAHREALKHLHPRLVRPVRIGNGILSDDVAGKVVGFLLLTLVIFGGGSFFIAATGTDMITSFSASATALGNVGPGLGAIDHSGDFLAIPRLGRALAMAQMLLGRLEIYPVILALSVVTLRLPRLGRVRRCPAIVPTDTCGLDVRRRSPRRSEARHERCSSIGALGAAAAFGAQRPGADAERCAHRDVVAGARAQCRTQ